MFGIWRSVTDPVYTKLVLIASNYELGTAKCGIVWEKWKSSLVHPIDSKFKNIYVVACFHAAGIHMPSHVIKIMILNWKRCCLPWWHVGVVLVHIDAKKRIIPRGCSTHIIISLLTVPKQPCPHMIKGHSVYQSKQPHHHIRTNNQTITNKVKYKKYRHSKNSLHNVQGVFDCEYK